MIPTETTFITLDLNKPTALVRKFFESWEIRYIAEHSFEEMWADANKTLQPGVRFNRLGNLWLERKGTIPLRGSHEALTGERHNVGRTLVDGEPKFEATDDH